MTPHSTVSRPWRNLPFAHKLAGLLIALVSLPIIVVVVYTTYTSREALLAATRARNLERAQATAQAIDAFFNEVPKSVPTFAWQARCRRSWSCARTPRYRVATSVPGVH
jgi:hypothetical protein